MSLSTDLIYPSMRRKILGLIDGVYDFVFFISCNLSDKSKPIIFSMARLDRVKNITGLVEWYGKNKTLREYANLVVVAGYNNVKRSNDREEIAEIEKMHTLIEKYKLDGNFRWISAQMNRVLNGEIYRCIADTKGVFVQVYASVNILIDDFLIVN